MMRRLTAVACAATLIVSMCGASGLTAAAAAPAKVQAKVKSYPNCAALNKDYPHGVGRKGAKDRGTGKSFRPVTNFTVNTAVYQKNTARDGDRDGIACEKR